MPEHHNILVCTSCLAPGKVRTNDRTDGDALFARMNSYHATWELADDVGLSAYNCLDFCKRPCSVALTGPGKVPVVSADWAPDADIGPIFEAATAFFQSRAGGDPGIAGFAVRRIGSLGGD